MSKLPALTGRQLISLLEKRGFESIRQRGSHVFMKHPDGRVTVVPVHQGETIGRGLLSQIMRDCELSRDDLTKKL